MEIKTFEEAIRRGDFILARKFIDLTDVHLLESKLSVMGIDNGRDLSPYLFILSLNLEKESAELHVLAATLISSYFVCIPGAYLLAIEHILRAIELEPTNLNYKQAILYYHDIPEQLLPKEALIQYAQQVLKNNSTVKVAKALVES